MLTVAQLLAIKGRQMFTVGPQDSVLRAIEIMATQHVGALLVMEQGALLGVISERDYARKVILKDRSSRETAVAAIMSSPVITVSPADTVKHCMEVCTRERIRHLPVIDGGRVVGVLSIGDLVKAMLQEQSEQIEQLERYIAG